MSANAIHEDDYGKLFQPVEFYIVRCLCVLVGMHFESASARASRMRLTLLRPCQWHFRRDMRMQRAPDSPEICIYAWITWNRENTCLFSKNFFSNCLIICGCFEVLNSLFCDDSHVYFRIWNKFLRLITIEWIKFVWKIKVADDF